MAGRSKYPDEARARAYVVWKANDGNVLRAAKEAGLPVQTVRNWAKAWANGSELPDNLPAQVVLEATNEYVEGMNEVRTKALARLNEIIHEETNTQRLATIVGIMDDKITRAVGLPTTRKEVVHSLPSAEKMREVASGFVSEIREAQMHRENIIIVDAESKPGTALSVSTD